MGVVYCEIVDSDSDSEIELYSASGGSKVT